tara:strand:+ start:562 stop:1344 length:783 start_codon:yes stop_codon:yes gene_type:complete
MKKKRLVPIFLLKDGYLVQSRNFSHFENIGDPFISVSRFSQWMVDELIYLNIDRENNLKNKKVFLKIIKSLSKEAFMPITVGGKINKLSDIDKLLSAGADKITINSIIFKKKEFISDSAKEFGSQCIVVSIDVKKIENEYFVFINNGKINTKIKLYEWTKICQNEGAGEILINSIDRDGSKMGYDFKILEKIKKIISVPLIFCGGAGKWNDFKKCLEKKEVDAAAAANIFHHYDQSDYLAKKYLYDKNVKNIRRPQFFNI